MPNHDDTDLGLPPDPAAAPDVASAPAPAPSKTGDAYRYTGGQVLAIETRPRFIVEPGATHQAMSDEQAMLMSGHPDFEAVAAPKQPAPKPRPADNAEESD